MQYTADHEFVKLDGKTATVGITNHAQEALGDLVFVELPAVGRKVSKGESIATVESVKAASEVYAPLSGTIAEVNQAIVDAPNLVNEDPENRGWFFKITLSNESETKELLDSAAYQRLLG
ncbi:MAG: glycine cleavage system protein GcvH [Candidatus Pacebacteria bacterium]|nr:glycine cleavage system protein GcvH [Candidatus Paceibacterota bacterium]